MNKDCQQIYQLYYENNRILTLDYYDHGIVDVSDYIILTHPPRLTANYYVVGGGGFVNFPWKKGDIVTWKRKIPGSVRRYGIIGRVYDRIGMSNQNYEVDEISEEQYLLLTKLKNKEDKQTGLDLLDI
jgi:hypothetical protein